MYSSLDFIITSYWIACAPQKPVVLALCALNAFVNEVQTVDSSLRVQLSCHTEIGLGTRFTKRMSSRKDEILVRSETLRTKKVRA